MRNKSNLSKSKDYVSKLCLYGKITEQHAKEIDEIINNEIEKVIEYISYKQGWEETGDIYRKHFKLPTKYDKLSIKNNLSLCSSCFCMTKTINNKCGKCGEDKKVLKPLTQQDVKKMVKIIKKGKKIREEHDKNEQ